MKNRWQFAFVLILFLASCEDRITRCNLAEQDIKNWHGSVRIDSIFSDWRNHAHAAIDTQGNQVLFEVGDMFIEPQKGDSLFKDTGTVEYSLIRGDSIYIQKWDCPHLKQVIKAYKL